MCVLMCVSFVSMCTVEIQSTRGKLIQEEYVAFQSIKMAAHKDFGLNQHTYILDAFCFRLFTINPWNHETFFSFPIIISLFNNTKTRFTVSLVEYLFENMPLTEMLSGLKVAKKHMRIYYFHRKHFTCWDLRGML